MIQLGAWSSLPLNVYYHLGSSLCQQLVLFKCMRVLGKVLHTSRRHAVKSLRQRVGRLFSYPAAGGPRQSTKKIPSLIQHQLYLVDALGQQGAEPQLRLLRTLGGQPPVGFVALRAKDLDLSFLGQPHLYGLPHAGDEQQGTVSKMKLVHGGRSSAL
jgi:hypothetical protein